VALEIALIISGKNYQMTKQLALVVRIHANKGISIRIDTLAYAVHLFHCLWIVLGYIIYRKSPCFTTLKDKWEREGSKECVVIYLTYGISAKMQKCKLAIF